MKDLAFQPPAYLPEVETPEGECDYQTYMESMSVYMRVKELYWVFNSSQIPKAVNDAKEMIEMKMGEAAPLENLFLTVLARAQEDEFWQKLDEIVARLCQLRNDWLDHYFYSSLTDLVEEVVVTSGPGDFEYDDNLLLLFGNLTNITGDIHRQSADEFFSHKLPSLFCWLK